jgi:hypothetical protein
LPWSDRFAIINIVHPMQQRSPEHMAPMRARKLMVRQQEIVTRVNVETQTIETGPRCIHESTGNGQARSAEFQKFARQVIRDVYENMFRVRPEYSDATYQFAFIIRTMCAVCYEFVRTIIPLPTLNHVDDKFRDNLDRTGEAMSNIDHLPYMLQYYRGIHISQTYDQGVKRDLEE